MTPEPDQIPSPAAGGEREVVLPPPEEWPAAAFLFDRAGQVLAANDACRRLLGLPARWRPPHLVAHRLLAEGEPALARLCEAARAGRPARARLQARGGEPRETLFALGISGAGRFLAVALDAGEQGQAEAALRRELQRLEELLDDHAEPDPGWAGAAAGLLALLPGPAVLLDRKLRPLLPRQGEDGPAVLCSVHLLGSPGRCRECLAARALRLGREAAETIDGRLVRARPLPGGFVLEWTEAPR